MKNLERRPPDRVVTFMHNFSEELAKKTVLKTNLSPNQLTIASFFFMIVAFVLFSFGNYWLNFWALFSILISAFLDFSDGVVWRTKNLSTPLGAWLDPALDAVSQLLILLGICFGVIHSQSGSLFWSGVCLSALFVLAVNNLITQQFNRVFGFDSYIGLPEFAEKVKKNLKTFSLDFLAFNIVTPTNPFFIVIFTIRYFIIFGLLFNFLPLAIFFFSIFNLFRAIGMYFIYAATLIETKNSSGVIHALKLIKEERNSKGKR